MILVNEWKDGKKSRSYTVRGFAADYGAKPVVLVLTDGSTVEKGFSSFDHNHITGSDYHIISMECPE
jgi:hypothetical protein